MTIEVRLEVAADESAVARVHELAFGRVEEADLVNALRAGCRDRLSLVAVRRHEIVGHVLFTPVRIESEAGTNVGMGLAPLGVLPAQQRSRIGRRLVEAGLERLRRHGVAFVVVLGDPAYYGRFGFVPAARFGVRTKWEGIPDDAFQILLLKPDLAAVGPGIAQYRPEFDAVA